MDALNDILAAAAVGLSELYPDIKIYNEDVPNEFPDKCFMLGFAGEPEIKKISPNRYKLSGKLDIAYYSTQNALLLRAEFNRVFYSLSLNLQIISFNNLTIRLNAHASNTVDGVLHDLCSFETFIAASDDTPLITTINIKGV